MESTVIQDWLIQVIISAVLLLYPTWRIYKRAGLNPILSLTVLIPLLGIPISAMILIFSKWNLKNEVVK